MWVSALCGVTKLVICSPNWCAQYVMFGLWRIQYSSVPTSGHQLHVVVHERVILLQLNVDRRILLSLWVFRDCTSISQNSCSVLDRLGLDIKRKMI